MIQMNLGNEGRPTDIKKQTYGYQRNSGERRTNKELEMNRLTSLYTKQAVLLRGTRSHI